MPKVLGFFGIALATSCIFTACGGSDKKADDTGDTVKVCTPGTYFDCIGPGTCAGHNSCLNDGTGYTTCACDIAAGSGGGAGTNVGAAGVNAGTAGTTAGSAGTTAMNDGDAAVGNEDASTNNPGPKCGTKHACVPAVSDGFKGPIELYVGSAAPPSCDSAFEAEAFEGTEEPSADPASCSACTCTPMSGACPTFLDFSTSATTGCGEPACTTSLSSSCAEISPPCLTGVTTASLKTKLPSALATCKASKSTATKPAIDTGKHVSACAAGGLEKLDCKSGEVCASEPSAKYQDQLCIWRTGSHSCPANSDYSDRRVYYRGVVDTRACSACECDGPDCTMSWQVFAAADTACATPLVSLSSPDQCVSVNPVSDKLRVGVTLGGTGTCAPSGGDPEGDVTGDDPVTVCCLE